MVQDFLKTDHKIYDSLHGFIRFGSVEKSIINSMPFQRLHQIHQLGAAFLVFPGATHSRFQHSLGVMELATRVYEKICKQPGPDLFHELPRKGSLDYYYYWLVLRIAALCHDLGHLPFSHVAEKDILPNQGHEIWTIRILKESSIFEIFETLKENALFQKFSKDKNFLNDVIKVAVGPKKIMQLNLADQYVFSPWEKVLSEIITGDFFGVDRIDYLLRDAKNTGIAYGVFDYLQMIEMIRVIPINLQEKLSLSLGIDASGLESCESLLLARHFMYKRVYHLPSVKAFNFHLKAFMKKTIDLQELQKDVFSYLSYHDPKIICNLYDALNDLSHPGHDEAEKIILRKGHFKAIALPENITEKFLSNFQKENNLDSNHFAYELNQEDFIDEVDFYVLLKDLQVQKAAEQSILLAKIPGVCKNWAYISADYHLLLVESIKNNEIL